MPTQEQLKNKLFNELECWPRIKTFFESMLRNRLSGPIWLENGLVQLLLRNTQANLSMLDEFLKKLEHQQSALFGQMSNELKGTEPDFNTRIDDLLAELHAISWLVDNDFSGIVKLPRGDGKTPDFEAKKDNLDCFFEVKNLQAPDDLLYFVFLQLGIKELLQPELYKAYFHFDLSLGQNSIDEINDTDKLNVHRFVAEIEDKLRGGAGSAEIHYRNTIKDKQVTKTLRCSWKCDSQFDMTGHSSRYAISPGNPPKSLKLLPLMRKTWEQTSRAIEQLMEYDNSNSHDKWVLINWQKTPDFIFDAILSQKYRNIIETMNDVIANINPRLHIHLL